MSESSTIAATPMVFAPERSAAILELVTDQPKPAKKSHKKHNSRKAAVSPLPAANTKFIEANTAENAVLERRRCKVAENLRAHGLTVNETLATPVRCDERRFRQSQVRAAITQAQAELKANTAEVVAEKLRVAREQRRTKAEEIKAEVMAANDTLEAEWDKAAEEAGIWAVSNLPQWAKSEVSSLKAHRDLREGGRESVRRAMRMLNAISVRLDREADLDAAMTRTGKAKATTVKATGIRQSKLERADRKVDNNGWGKPAREYTPEKMEVIQAAQANKNVTIGVANQQVGNDNRGVVRAKPKKGGKK